MNVLSLRAATLAVALVCAAQAEAAPHTLTLDEGQQKTWSQLRPVKRAATGNEEIVGINVVPPRGVIITAKKPGTTMVSVWDDASSEPAAQFQVVVNPASLNMAKQALGSDAARAQISGEGAKLRLSGALSSLERHGQVESALKSTDDKNPTPLVDSSTSNFDVQVQIDIKIVEVSRQKLKEAGFYATRGTTNSSFGVSGPNNLSSLQQDAATGYRQQLNSSAGFIPFSDAFNIFKWTGSSMAVFSALESNGFAYTLAEPSLTALSGQTATFLAGGEYPVPFRSGAEGAITVMFKEFGIRLGLTPTVLDANRITLQVAPEVSEIDPSLAVQLSGFTIPGLTVRRTETTVAIGDGETFVISGLVSRKTTSSIDKFPFLGDIPILGMFFKSDRFDREDKELLMIATPHLVRPFAKNAKLPPLPGEEVRHYDPGFMRMLLIESGQFKSTDSGFSN
jgi:pilus assembly protein CpaC